MKLKRRSILLVSFLGGLILLGAVARLLHHPQAPLYREVAVGRGRLESNVLSAGTVEPENRVEIRPPMEGRVEEILFEEGQKIRKGQVLAWMSSNERASLLDAARAKGPDELKRWEGLYRPMPILAPIDGTMILKKVEPGQTFINKDPLFVLADRLAVKAQVDETDIAQIHLKQDASITLDAYPEQSVHGRVNHIGYEVYRPEMGDSPSKSMMQYVTTYKVDVVPETIPDFFRSGMTANVRFLIASKENVLTLPVEAVQSPLEDHRFFVLLPPPKGGKEPVKKEVTTGISDGKQIEIVSGLSENDRVLIPLPKPEEKEEPSFFL